MTKQSNANDENDGETARREDVTVISPLSDIEADENRSDYVRDRLGLSIRQWELLVSVVVFLPYPLFVALILTDTVQSLEFLLLTLVYSVFAMCVNLVL
jgi:hypothetical protein